MTAATDRRSSEIRLARVYLREARSRGANPVLAAQTPSSVRFVSPCCAGRLTHAAGLRQFKNHRLRPTFSEHNNDPLRYSRRRV